MDAAVDALREATRLLVVSGAGASTASGIPDFRSASGVWARFDPREFHLERWRADPAGFWRLRARLMEALDLANAKPNAAHEALAAASRSPRFLGHVAQNIDGLFLRAGHDEGRIVEIHGTATKVRCLACDRFFPFSVVTGETMPPPCPACGAPLKPGSVLFGEPLPPGAWAQAERWARDADALLVVGSGLEVTPVALLPGIALERGARLVIANATATRYDADADAVLRGPVEETVPALLAAIGMAPPR